jgi:hypothetical protein
MCDSPSVFAGVTTEAAGLVAADAVKSGQISKEVARPFEILQLAGL